MPTSVCVCTLLHVVVPPPHTNILPFGKVKFVPAGPRRRCPRQPVSMLMDSLDPCTGYLWPQGSALLQHSIRMHFQVGFVSLSSLVSFGHLVFGMHSHMTYMCACSFPCGQRGPCGSVATITAYMAQIPGVSDRMTRPNGVSCQ